MFICVKALPVFSIESSYICKVFSEFMYMCKCPLPVFMYPNNIFEKVHQFFLLNSVHRKYISLAHSYFIKKMYAISSCQKVCSTIKGIKYRMFGCKTVVHVSRFHGNEKVQGQMEERLGKPFWKCCHTNGVFHEMFPLVCLSNFKPKL